DFLMSELRILRALTSLLGRSRSVEQSVSIQLRRTCSFLNSKDVDFLEKLFSPVMDWQKPLCLLAEVLHLSFLNIRCFVSIRWLGMRLHLSRQMRIDPWLW